VLVCRTTTLGACCPVYLALVSELRLTTGKGVNNMRLGIKKSFLSSGKATMFYSFLLSHEQRQRTGKANKTQKMRRQSDEESEPLEIFGCSMRAQALSYGHTLLQIGLGHVKFDIDNASLREPSRFWCSCTLKGSGQS
jgi:hypothetical protein